ncbi:site-specific integrase [Zoogloea sp. LCSB751]|uniref:tyrosine-type recombinase/integrase n=1 Tax=Zoogloea sp. LCSB751 TaxID=1965277 RepID=UPI0009A52F30|nr:site-specific integrase [Zoogloea sp. LCSB751]
MASITKRGDYQYQAIIRRKGYPKQCATFESYEDAERWALDIESKMLQRVFTDRSELERTTLGELLDRYQNAVVVNNIGARQELSRVKRWKAHPLALRTLDTLRAVDFSQYRDARLKEVGPNTVRLELALISAMFNYARKNWSIPVENPIEGIRGPKIPGGRERRLRGDEEVRLLEAASEARSNPVQLKAAIQLAIETGLREGRLASLRWDQVDLEAEDEEVIWVLTKAESHKQRWRPVPLTEKAVEVLKGLPRDESGFVFGQAFPTVQALGSAFRRARDRAGLENFRFHDLRHEAASRMAPIMAGGTLAKIMTWDTLELTMRYYNPTARELVAAVRGKRTAP